MLYVFLICTERSGSNFLTNLLGGHSKISAPPPTHLFRLFANNEKNYGDLDNDKNWRILINDVIDNFNAKLGYWNTSVTFDELLDNVNVRNSTELLSYIYNKEALFDKARVVFIKENHTYDFADYLQEHLDNCKFVYMVRDPRDVASSWLNTKTIPGGIEKAIDTWIVDQKGALELYESIHNDNIHLVKYESLVSDTIDTIRKLTDFIGIEFEEGILDFYKNPRTISNANRIEAWANLSKPVIQNNYGKYHDLLTNDEIKYIEYRCHNLMKRFNYNFEIADEAMNMLDNGILSEVSRIGKNLNPGNYVIDNEEESNIRARRLEAINTVINRRL